MTKLQELNTPRLQDLLDKAKQSEIKSEAFIEAVERELARRSNTREKGVADDSR